jgi:3-phosphoshikimate 1-carboxyvinyltransferase
MEQNKIVQLVVYKTLNLYGKTVLPGSKSQSIRGMFFALLAKGKSILFNVVDSDDTQTAMRICRALGAKIILQDNTLFLTSNGFPFTHVAHEIHTGNSGITTRFILPLLGLRKNYMSSIFVTCSEQMQVRPIKALIDALNVLGMFIQYAEQEEQFPILVSGQLKGGEVEIDGITSQYLSALLISLPCAQKDSVVTVKDLHERPYIEMTLAWLSQQGIQYNHKEKNGIDIFSIRGRQCYQSFQAIIAGDFSSASCLLAAASLFPGAVELHGLDMNDAQGDKQLIFLLKKMGANIAAEQERIQIKGGQTLYGISIDANSIPDLLPALAVIATQAVGKTEIFNVKQARIKEADRICSMTEGLKRMGAKIEEHIDGMTIYQSDLNGAIVKGYADHRTVMALTIAGMLADGETVITDGEAITKTYPGFVEAMKALGARIDFKKVS